MGIFLIVLPNPGVEDIMTDKVILTQPRPWCKEPICEQETHTQELFNRDQRTHVGTFTFSIHQREDIQRNVRKEIWAKFKIRKTSFMDHRANIYVLLAIHFIGCVHMGLLLICVTEGETV